MDSREVSKRWPHIWRYLRVESSGRFDHKFHTWDLGVDRLSPAEQAAAYEEWADFWEFRLAQWRDELAGDRRKWGPLEEWTDEMAYGCRRCAAYARGEDPGEPVPLSVRRPDLYAAKRARVAEIIAEVDASRTYDSVAGTYDSVA
ncbi:MAG TPA: hypothetical protein VGR06_05055 [Actinophytocola sp.]|jgi:hypothetical protein|uniref:hypothetical protein n=1 Tax=Actinophytocola sp. TaxID=1872138 RepID=UPI002E099890|nr:hypothetical protein [Actinophytocola sp.]